MNAQIDQVKWGTISIDGATFEYDVVIGLDGTVKKRKKKLSKQLYGTSHTISQAEAESFYEPGAELLLIGSGLFDRVRLSDEAAAYLAARNVQVQIEATPKAARTWNQLEAQAIGLFHLTC